MGAPRLACHDGIQVALRLRGLAAARAPGHWPPTIIAHFRPLAQLIFGTEMRI
jgi:hypothetical protein